MLTPETPAPAARTYDKIKDQIIAKQK